MNNKDTRTTSLTSLWCLYCSLRTYFTPCSSVFIVNFEHISPLVSSASIVNFEKVYAGWRHFDKTIPQSDNEKGKKVRDNI